MDLIVWIIVGLIAGWLAGQVMKGSGYGVLGDIVLGLIGGVLGGWLVGLVAPTAEPSGFVGSIIVATIGAVILVIAARAVSGRKVARA